MKNIFKSGDVYIWSTGIALIFSLLMIAGLIFIIASMGLGFFWPGDVRKVTLHDGMTYLGQVTDREVIPDMSGEEILDPEYRVQLKIGNRDIYGRDFIWIKENDIKKIDYPAEAMVIERTEWGNLYGYFEGIELRDRIVQAADPDAYSLLQNLISDANKKRSMIQGIERGDIGAVNYNIEQYRLAIRSELLKREPDREKISELEAKVEEERAKFDVFESRLMQLYTELNENRILFRTVEGQERAFPAGVVIRVYKPNEMGFASKTYYYFSKFWEFITEYPREANTEGGIFPAIFGTVMMVLIMSIAVMPFGILAALYLREYAKQGPLVRTVRICVNNLAGVPSIVYGVFGVGFFIYGIGGLIDSVFFQAALPSPTFGTGGILWASLTLALLTVPVVIVSTEEGLAAVPRNIRDGSLALGATKFETIWKIVLPSALPAILTGLILAIARATGEVAPLMITGVVKLAPDLPIDGNFPFLHLERKFMHLGYHIYDVGFQSPNVEAAKPMVFATALLLICIVIVLNLTAIILRNKLKKRYSSSGV